MRVIEVKNLKPVYIRCTVANVPPILWIRQCFDFLYPEWPGYGLDITRINTHRNVGNDFSSRIQNSESQETKKETGVSFLKLNK